MFFFNCLNDDLGVPSINGLHWLHDAACPGWVSLPERSSAQIGRGAIKNIGIPFRVDFGTSLLERGGQHAHGGDFVSHVPAHGLG